MEETTEVEEIVVVDKAARIEEIFRGFETKGAVGASGDASYLFELEGDDGGTHLLKVSPTGVSWESGYSGEADVSVKLSVDDFLAVADGNFDGRLAVASERIELSGNMELAEGLVGYIEPEETL
jgi:putative sterol carrier protein